MTRPLYIVACSATKHPSLRTLAMPARDAYTGHAFRLSRRWMESIRAQWCILSANYGFLWPDTVIEHYEARFQNGDDPAIWEPFEAIKQKQYARLVCASSVVVLGSALYARMASGFLERPVTAPLAGLPIGKALAALKQLSVSTQRSAVAVATGDASLSGMADSPEPTL